MDVATWEGAIMAMTLICCHQAQVLAVTEIGTDGAPAGIVGERPEDTEQCRAQGHRPKPLPTNPNSKYMAGRGSWVISKEDRRSAVQYRILLPYIRVGTGWKLSLIHISEPTRLALI
eukprot:13511102-Alexandrium_andersonii.AAC.1